jgi:RNA polymerase-binding transcription factor DksA
MTHHSEHIRRKLLALRNARLLRRQGQLARTDEELESRETAWEDQAAESTDAVVGDSLAHVDFRQIQEIDAALAREDAGVYGQCVSCHQPVEVDRLDAVPWTAYCAACADDVREDGLNPGRG